MTKDFGLNDSKHFLNLTWILVITICI